MVDKYGKFYKQVEALTKFLEEEKLGAIKGTFTSGWRFSFTHGKKAKRAKIKVSK